MNPEDKLKLATEIDEAGVKLTECVKIAEEQHINVVDDLLALKDVVNKLKVKVINEIK